MQYDNLDPLYKILCLALIFLVPLAPAWGLYKIAPEDKFLANGTFSGFKINATGSAAMYIVLFAAAYWHTDGILKDIDTVHLLKAQNDSLVNNRPWTIQYKLTLMKADSSREIDPLQYDSIVNQNSIVCTPGAFHLGDDKKTVSFYVENVDDILKDNPIESQIVINGYSTSMIPVPITPKTVDRTKHIITIEPIICMRASNTTPANYIKNHKVLSAKDGSLRPPSGGPGGIQ
jgi:hypothetical protein